MEGLRWIWFSLVLFAIGKSTAHLCHPRVGCPFNWEPWGDSCYRPTEERLSWADAGLECQAMGGEMAAPSSEEENDYILSVVGIRSWINCNDIADEGQWVCKIDSEYMYSNWHKPEEPNGGKGENCALAIQRFGGQWSDARCDETHAALCKGKQVRMKSWRLLGYCLMGHILREFPTSGGVRPCAVICAYEPRCRSFNLLHFGGGETVCQLNNDTRFEVDHAQFRKMDNFCIYGEK